MRAEQGCDLGLDRLIPRRPRARPEKVGCIFGRRRSISAVPDWAPTGWLFSAVSRAAGGAKYRPARTTIADQFFRISQSGRVGLLSHKLTSKSEN